MVTGTRRTPQLSCSTVAWMEIVQLSVKLVFYSCVFYVLSSAAIMYVSDCVVFCTKMSFTWLISSPIRQTDEMPSATMYNS